MHMAIFRFDLFYSADIYVSSASSALFDYGLILFCFVSFDLYSSFFVYFCFLIQFSSILIPSFPHDFCGLGRVCASCGLTTVHWCIVVACNVYSCLAARYSLAVLRILPA